MTPTLPDKVSYRVLLKSLRLPGRWTPGAQIPLLGLGLIFILLLLPLPAKTSIDFSVQPVGKEPVQTLWVPSAELNQISVVVNADELTSLGDSKILEVAGITLLYSSNFDRPTISVLRPNGSPELKVILESETKNGIGLDTLVGVSTADPGEELNAPHFLIIEGLNTEVIKRLDLEVFSFGENYFWMRFALWVFAAFLLSAFLFNQRRRPPLTVHVPSHPIQRREERSNLVAQRKIATVALGVYLFAYAIFGAPKHDDGWVQHRATSFLSRGFFGNIYSNNDAMVPQGWIPELLTAGLASLGAEGVHFRIVSAVFCLVSWRVLIKTIDPANALISNKFGLILTSASYGIFCSTYLIGLRPELFVVLAGSLFFYYAQRFFQSGSLDYYALSVIFAGQAFIAHQSGVATLVPAIVLVTIGIRRGISEGCTREIWRGNLAASLFALISLFVPGSPDLIVREGLKFLSSSHSPQVIGGEFARIESLFLMGSDSLSLILVPIVIVVALWVFSILPTKTGFSNSIVEPVNQNLLILATTWPIGLFLTSTKWEWHYGVLAVSVVVWIGVVTPSALQRRLGKIWLIPFLISVFALWVGVTSEPLYVEGAHGFTLISQIEKLTAVGNVPWLATLIATGLILVLIGRMRQRGILIFLTIGVLGAAAAPLALGVGTSLWSRGTAPASVHVGQLGLQPPEKCTDFGETLIVTPSELPRNITLGEAPRGKGRFVTPFGIPLVSTSHYPLHFEIVGEAGSRAGFWTQGTSSKTTVSLTINGQREEFSANSSPGEIWELHSVELEDGINNISLHASSSKHNLTVPVLLKKDEAIEALRGKSLVRAPAWFGLGDCLDSTTLEADVVGSIDFFGNPYSMSPIPPLVEVSIQKDSVETRGNSIFRPLHPFASVERK